MTFSVVKKVHVLGRACEGRSHIAGPVSSGVLRTHLYVLWWHVVQILTQSLLQRRNFTLAFQAAESVGIKSTLVSPPPPIPSGLLSVRKRSLPREGRCLWAPRPRPLVEMEQAFSL